MYKLTHVAFHKTSSNAEVGIPLFSIEKSNFLFVAETDNYLQIIVFVPLIEIPDHDIIPHEAGEKYSAGDQSPVALRYNGHEICVRSLQFCIENYEDIIDGSDALFAYELGGIVGREDDEREKFRRLISADFFTDKHIAENWLNIENKSVGASRVYWSSIEERRLKNRPNYIYEVNSISSLDDAFTWLISRQNISRKSWFDVWSLTREFAPYNELISRSAIDWIAVAYSSMTPPMALNNEHFVAVLRHVTERGLGIQEVADILEELFSFSSDAIGIFVNSRLSYRAMKIAVEESGGWSHSEKIDYWAHIKGYQ